MRPPFFQLFQSFFNPYSFYIIFYIHKNMVFYSFMKSYSHNKLFKLSATKKELNDAQLNICC